MRSSVTLEFSHFTRLIKVLYASLLRSWLQRRIFCLAVALNLLLWQGPGFATRYLFDAICQGTSTAIDAHLLSSTYEAFTPELP